MKRNVLSVLTVSLLFLLFVSSFVASETTTRKQDDQEYLDLLLQVKYEEEAFKSAMGPIISPFITPTRKLPKHENVIQRLQVFTRDVPNLVLANRNSGIYENGNDSGGALCAGCVIVVRIIEQIALVQEPSIEKAVLKFCDMLSGELQTACHIFVTLYGKQVIELLEEKQNPDVVCHEVKLCNNRQCILYDESKKAAMWNQQDDLKDVSQGTYKNLSKQDLKNIIQIVKPHRLSEWWKDLFKRIYDVFDSHIPAFDFDADGFATTFTLRGSAWRGKDCNDDKKDVYPGRRVNSYDASVDHNCNGIYGKNDQGQSYEDLLCSKYPQKGVIALGDSACAHFRIPPQWVDAKLIDKQIFKPAIQILENEMDWPHLGWFTAHYQNDTTGLTPGPVDSIYMRMKARNRCVHRDYQALCVNGARTGAMQTIVKTVSRNTTTDQPAIVFYALVGNDVCTPHPSFDHFTSPEQFYSNVVGALDYLDTVLAPKSTVVFIGLAEGGILYDTLWNETHPLGASYKNVYDFLNCLQINPCWGWMNSNATVRNVTSQHARELSKVYMKIIADKKDHYKNFDMLYHDFPMDKAIEQYKKMGGKVKDLIEPMDGFHPSQIAHALIAPYVFQDLTAKHPDLFGPENPNNEMIDKLFGDQGGY